MNLEGTEYRLERTVTCAKRSTRGVSQSPVSNGSTGSGLRRWHSAFAGLSCKVAAVELGDRAHHAVQQHAAWRFVNILSDRHEPGA